MYKVILNNLEKTWILQKINFKISSIYKKFLYKNTKIKKNLHYHTLFNIILINNYQNKNNNQIGIKDH